MGAVNDLLQKKGRTAITPATPPSQSGASAVSKLLQKTQPQVPSRTEPMMPLSSFVPVAPVRYGPFSQKSTSQQQAPKVTVKDVMKEVPGATAKVAKGVVNFFTSSWQKLVKGTGERVGEAAAYQTDKTVQQQVAGGNINNLITQQSEIIKRMKGLDKTSDRYKKLYTSLQDVTQSIQRAGGNGKEIISRINDTYKQVAGEALGAFVEAAPYAKLAGGGSAVSKLITKIGSKAPKTALSLQGAKVAGTLGLGYGASGALQENKSAGEIITQALKTGATSAVVGAVAAPILGSLAGKFSKKGITGAPKAPEVAKEVGTYTGGVTLPTKAQKIATKGSNATKQASLALDKGTLNVYRSKGNLGAITRQPGAFGKAWYVTPDKKVAGVYDRLTGGKGIEKGQISIKPKEILDLSIQDKLSEFTNRAIKKYPLGPEKTGESIQRLAKDLGYKAIKGEEMTGIAVLNTARKSVASKQGASVLSPSVIKSFQKQASDQVAYHSPGLDAALRKVDLSKTTTIPEAERKLLAALPDDAPASAKQAISAWAKSTMQTVYQTQVALPAEATKIAKTTQTATKITKKAESFARRVAKATETNPNVASKLNATYKPITNEATLKAANANIQKMGVNKAVSAARSVNQPTAQSNVEAMILIKKLQDKGDYQAAIDLVEHTSSINKKSGQSIQALAMYDRLTPEGVLRYAQKTIGDYNAQLSTSLGGKVPKDKLLKISPDLAKQLVERAQVIQKMPDGLPKSVETAKMLKTIADQVPKDFWSKVSLTQTFGQLLNPKTLVRNVIGNSGFQVLENVTNPVRVAIDIPLSKITGQRTASLSGFKSQFTGAVQGARIGKLEAQYGVTLDASATKFDLPTARTFKGKVGSALESGLNWGLRFPDRISYQSAFDQKAAELTKLVKSGKASYTNEDIAKAAHEYGLYRTFQDDSLVSKATSKIKSGLNFGQKFGLGDIVLKYPRTPGNLLSRALAYSPTGFINTVFQGTRPLIGKIVGKPMPFNQAKFVDSFARAIVGSGALAGTGAALKSSGIITSAKKETDIDVAALKQQEGIGPYRINYSALKRFISSGFKKQSLQENDTLVSFDWFQPQAVMIAIGARMADREDKTSSITDVIINSLAEGVNTIVEQPLLKGVQRLFNFNDKNGIMSKIIDTAIQTPASFIPTIFSQINQVLDNQQRETYSNLWWKEMLYTAMSKVPVLAQKVPPRIDVFGRESKRYQWGSNSVMNVFFNPAFISTFKPNPLSKPILDLYDKTGEKGQFPSVIAKKQQINGESIELTSEQYKKMQTYVGSMTTKLYMQRIGEADWNDLPDLDKVKELSNIASDVRSAAKIKMLGNKPGKIPKSVQDIIDLPTPKVYNMTERRELSDERIARSKSGVINYLKDYAKALKTDPMATAKIIFGKEVFRKVENDAVIVERMSDIADLDLGDPNSAIDHVIPLGLGGMNNLSNLQILSNDEKGKKDRVEKYLIRKLQDGKINKQQAQKLIRKWRNTYQELFEK